MLTTDELPDDVEALKALVLEERAARLAIDAALLASHAECVALEAVRKDRDATIAYLQLQIQKMQRDKFGRSSERTKHLLDQFQLVTQPPDPGRLFGDSVRLSFWLGVGGQGPLSGALA